MKYIFAALMLVSAQAMKLSGVDTDDIRTGNHWKRKWPEGAIDDGTDDGDVLNRFNVPMSKKKKPAPKETYPWTYSADVIATGKNIENAETKLKKKLTYDSVAIQRGRNWTFENNKASKASFEARRDTAPKVKA